MEISDLFSHINWLGVVVLTIVSFMLGALWHSKILFGKTWKAENNYGENVKVNAPLVFGGTALMHFILLAGISAHVSGHGAVEGLMIALTMSIIFVLPVMAGTYLFANRSLKLLAIDAGMYIVLFALSGLVLGIW